jgi:hypothetical protein
VLKEDEATERTDGIDWIAHAEAQIWSKRRPPDPEVAPRTVSRHTTPQVPDVALKWLLDVDPASPNRFGANKLVRSKLSRQAPKYERLDVIFRREEL